MAWQSAGSIISHIAHVEGCMGCMNIAAKPEETGNDMREVPSKQ